MNLIDGSSVWLQAVAQTLTSLPWVEVTLPLRVGEKRDVLTAALRDHPRIELLDPTPSDDRALGAAEAADWLEALDAESRFDLVLLRGRRVSEEASRRQAFPGRLWVYYLPPHEHRPGEEVEHLRLIAAASERILCQTEPIRALAQAAAPEDAARMILLPPMIPSPRGPSPRAERAGPLKLIYAGKFAPEYYFLEMVETFRRLRRSHPEAELHLVGDKVHNPPDDPGFKVAAERALAETENVIWHGGVSRERVAELLREADVALSIRHPMMDKELATKLLEYGAAGCAVVLNWTPIYDELLGPDYPLFATDPGEALTALLALAEDPTLRAEAAERCARAGREHSFERVASRLEPELLDLVRDQRRSSKPDRGLHLLIAGHDLRFLDSIPDHARARSALIREEIWAGHDQHDESVSRQLLGWAETVFCEWCLGNAAWYSRHIQPEQRLVIRFHRQERETDFPSSVAIDRVDRVVFVARHQLEEAAEMFSWPEEKLLVIPNAVDVEALRLPKLPWGSFNLAVTGWVPKRKRLDRALDLLELLRAEDPRFRLLLKGRPPWHYEWLWQREDERAYFEEQLRRVRGSRLLSEGVSFEPFGEDIPAFLQKVGMLLSTSDHEGHQVALAEGMASGCVPVILERPGAREQYSDRWVHPSPEAAAPAILELFDRDLFVAEQRLAQQFARRWSLDAIMPMWDRVLGLPSPASGGMVESANVTLASG